LKPPIRKGLCLVYSIFGIDLKSFSIRLLSSTEDLSIDPLLFPFRRFSFLA